MTSFSNDAFPKANEHLLESYFDSCCTETFSDKADPAQAQFEFNAEEMVEHLSKKDKTDWSKAELGLLALLCNTIF